MDVVLTLASFGLSSYLPKCVQPPQTNKIEAPPLSIRVAATLSFLLLALSIIDSIPMSWMVFLDDRSLPVAYRSVLILLVACVLVVFPAILGARIVGYSTDDLKRTSNNTSVANSPNYCRRNSYSGWAGFCCKLGSLTSNLVWILIHNLLIRPFCRLLGRRSVSSTSSSSVLPTTNVQSPVSSGVRSSNNPVFFHFRCLTILGSLTAIGMTIFLLSTISPWFVRTTSHQQHALSVAVSWLCALGILLSSIVNGFGSVSLPYSCLAGLYLEPISEDAVQRAKQELDRTRQSIVKRQEELLSEAPTSSNTARLNSRWSFSPSTSEERHQESRRSQLTQDIEFLTTLVQELEQEVFDMMEAKEMAAEARTTWGRIRSWLGVMFSIILILRLFGAAWFVWLHNHGGSRGAGSDLVTMTVLWLIGHNYVSQQQYNTLSQVISLLLTAYLSMAQVRTFVRAVDAVYRRIQQCWRPCTNADEYNDSSVRLLSLHSKLRSGSAYAPVVASLMSCYFLACVVLTKLLVPSAYRKALAVALETNDASQDESQLFRFFLRIRSYAVNSVFLVTALITTVVLGMMLGLKRQQSLRHRSSAPKMLIESA